MMTIKQKQAFENYKKYLTRYEHKRTISTWKVLLTIFKGWFGK